MSSVPINIHEVNFERRIEVVKFTVNFTNTFFHHGKTKAQLIQIIVRWSGEKIYGKFIILVQEDPSGIRRYLLNMWKLATCWEHNLMTVDIVSISQSLRKSTVFAERHVTKSIIHRKYNTLSWCCRQKLRNIIFNFLSILLNFILYMIHTEVTSILISI